MPTTLLDVNVLVALATHHRGRIVTFDRGLASLDPSRATLLAMP